MTGDSHLDAYARWAVVYPSGGRELTGYFLPLDAPGPQRTVMFNHGSGGLRAHDLEGIASLRALGYAVFVPIRRGHHANSGAYWLDRITHPWGDPAMGPQLVAALEDECEDVLAGMDWLCQQPSVDATRLAMCGHSFGGVMVIFAAARTARFRAGVSFAGASQSWPDVPFLRDALTSAVRQTHVPLFLLQAANDHSLLATYSLGAELFRSGRTHETRIYGPVGNTPLEGHGLFGRAPHLWRDDVRRFLETYVT